MDTLPVLIILCGGKSKRMGTPKGLLSYHGTPWLLEQIWRYNVVDKAKVYIGLGYDYKLYFEAIPWLKEAAKDGYVFKGIDCKTFVNSNPKLGPFSTLVNVLRYVDKTRSVLILPIDVPLLNSDDLQYIINENNTIVIPQFNNKNGHPVLLRPDFWNKLLSVNLHAHEARLDIQIKASNNLNISYISISDNSVSQNINTYDDWEKFMQKNNGV